MQGGVFFQKRTNSLNIGERTLDGYVRNNANPEILLTTSSSRFDNTESGNSEFKRFGAKPHYGIATHSH